MARLAAYKQHHEQSEGACAHAIGQSEKAERALAQSEAICRAHGVRLTPIRRKVLETLYATRRPLGAYDLAEALAPDGRRLAPVTIYRALEFLIEQGLAHRLASQNAYIATFHDDHETTAFLICEECGDVNEINPDALSSTLAGLVQAEAFRPHARFLEITGKCSQC
ncbi:Fur family transcriptional regulator [Microvirga alba]|uniref:Transcriptional repressor n=1 Tax=Microvirga alba TaxID=2791025 RepID=A0A931FPS1_9HYPH|nr:Fur family transcriptional regulator [Microvirga alba]MBF9232718.1 transcriptional repressor [Microvirga alba]